MQDNTPFHAAKAFGFDNETFGVCPPNSSVLNAISSWWSIVKHQVYLSGKQYSSKDELWMAIKESAANIPWSTIMKLTVSVNDILFIVIKATRLMLVSSLFFFKLHG